MWWDESGNLKRMSWGGTLRHELRIVTWDESGRLNERDRSGAVR